MIHKYYKGFFFLREKQKQSLNQNSNKNIQVCARKHV